MIKYISFLVLFVLALGALVGCSRERRPEGFPKLYPCTIQITQEGVPVPGVRVSLVHPELTARWAVGAETDDSGLATIRTHGFKGAPRGSYKVILSKKETVGRGWIGDEYSSYQGWEDMKIMSLIAQEYESGEETPLEIEVERSAHEKFDIGKAERRLVQVIRKGML